METSSDCPILVQSELENAAFKEMGKVATIAVVDLCYRRIRRACLRSH